MLFYRMDTQREMDQQVLTEYLRRSYFAVDGLWFSIVEKENSFEEALALDEQVWAVLAKIQARKAKALLGIEGCSTADLLRGLEVKLQAEGYQYTIAEAGPDRLLIHVQHCPWYALMKKAQREHLAGKVGDVICNRELQVWADELAKGMRFYMSSQLCRDGAACCWEYRLKGRREVNDPQRTHRSGI